MMALKHISESLYPYLAGELPDERCRQIEAHLRECPQCSEELRVLRVARDECLAYARITSNSPDLVCRVRTRLAAQGVMPQSERAAAAEPVLHGPVCLPLPTAELRVLQHTERRLRGAASSDTSELPSQVRARLKTKTVRPFFAPYPALAGACAVLVAVLLLAFHGGSLLHHHQGSQASRPTGREPDRMTLHTPTIDAGKNGAGSPTMQPKLAHSPNPPAQTAPNLASQPRNHTPARVMPGTHILSFTGKEAPSSSATSAPIISVDDRIRAQQVFAQLCAVSDPLPAACAGRPELDIVAQGDWNAGVVLVGKHPAHARVFITTGMLSAVVHDHQDFLAFILGHELAHVALGHSLPAASAHTPFLAATFTREQELTADQSGMDDLVKAGYSARRALEGTRTFRAQLQAHHLDYSSFEGKAYDHPSWEERLAQLDTKHAENWQAIDTFHAGVYLLTAEQYGLAADCFQKVAADFPASPEAYANLGYARLMQYADSLKPDDVRKLQVGLLYARGFYRQSDSLEPIERGIGADLWKDAIRNLRASERLDSHQALVEMNLGIAYLLRPDEEGDVSATDASAASRDCFARALALLKDDPRPETHFAVLVNAAVAAFGRGEKTNSESLLQQAEAFAPKAGEVDAETAVAYNRAFAANPRAADRQTFTRWEDALRALPASSAWWQDGYARYAEMGKAHGWTCKSPQELTSGMTAHYRPIVEVGVNDHLRVSLLDSLAAVRQRFGNQPVPRLLAPGTVLRSIDYPDYGLNVIGTRNVLVIRLHGERAPALSLQPQGLGTTPIALHTGMTFDQVRALLGGPDECALLLDGQAKYFFYRDLGLGLRVENAHVAEWLILRVP